MLYTTYSCNICRRTKDVELDTQRAIPNLCTITKGCLGRLSPIAQTQVATPTPFVENVEDWFARGSSTTATGSSTEEDFVLATSDGGSLVIALNAASEGTLPTRFNLNLLQRRGEDVAYAQYIFRPSSSTTTISGRDANGKNLRFDSTAISEERVYVRVDGVLRTNLTLTTDLVTFDSSVSAGSVVDIIVYNSAIFTVRQLEFTRNDTLTLSTVRGSWMNIDYVRRRGTSGKWWLYSADQITGISSGKMKVRDITDEDDEAVENDAMMLLASSPYEAVDRYLSFIVDIEDLKDSYEMYLPAERSAKVKIAASYISEIFPPLQFESESYLQDDPVATTASSEIQTNESNVRKATTKILGPV